MSAAGAPTAGARPKADREAAPWRSAPWAAIGGTVVAGILLPQVLARRNPPAVLTTADLLTCESRLDAGKASEVAVKLGLPPNRIKAMRAGVEVLLLLLDWYGLAVLHVSHQGLRHGMLLAYLERGEDWWRSGE